MSCNREQDFFLLKEFFVQEIELALLFNPNKFQVPHITDFFCAVVSYLSR